MRAHGSYLARKTREADPKTVGFGPDGEFVDIPKRLDSWRRGGDKRIWKLIISSEFGDRIDLNRLTRELMNRMGADLGSDALEWTAFAHCNTEHPHVHILRFAELTGVACRSIWIRIYLKSGIRRIAEDRCTQQVGYRTEKDAAAAKRREVLQRLYTSPDRIIDGAALSTTEYDDGRFSNSDLRHKRSVGEFGLRGRHAV